VELKRQINLFVVLIIREVDFLSITKFFFFFFFQYKEV
jgi:hypothetical protein